jgi:peptidyl-prolyl cis-trans isomerase C
MSTKHVRSVCILMVSLAGVVVAGCTFNPTLTSDEVPVVQTDQPAPTQTEAATLEPSPTPVDWAVQINETGITKAEYQAELARYQAATGTELATEDEEFVMQEMLNQLLLAQAAEEAGFVVDDDQISQRIAQLDISDQALGEWLSAHGYDEESFRSALKLSIAAAWMRDQIVVGVPETAEQVHARQILLYNSDEAEAVYAQLSSGADFATLAGQYDLLAKGDLGWFPRGYLTVPELDDVIFALEPGEYSPVVETEVGFHILQVVERDSVYPLNFSAYQIVQKATLENWIQERQAQSEIIYYLP